MEEKFLLVVLDAIDKKMPIPTIDSIYLDSLVTIGMIKKDLDTELTNFGEIILNFLRNKQYK